MKKDIINSAAYKKIIEDTVDKILHLPRDNRGARNKTPLDVYVKYIFFKLISGCSWDDFDALPNMPYTGDAIRKKFNIWCDAEIFNDQFHELVNIYINNEDIKELFMDSFDVLNSKGKLNNVSFGFKFRNKNALRTNVIVTEHLIGLAADLYPANIHDNKRIENIIEQLPLTLNTSYNNPIKICGDLGYMINKQRNQKIRSTYNFTIVTSKKKNMKKKKITKDNKKLLKKRICV